jgi:AcrR family transcriptional regulator
MAKTLNDPEHNCLLQCDLRANQPGQSRSSKQAMRTGGLNDPRTWLDLEALFTFAGSLTAAGLSTLSEYARVWVLKVVLTLFNRIQEVAAAAGVTNALIYRHFTSKEEHFREAVIAPLEERIAAQVASMKALPVDPKGAAQDRGTHEWVLELARFFRESIEGLGVVLFGDRKMAAISTAATFVPSWTSTSTPAKPTCPAGRTATTTSTQPCTRCLARHSGSHLTIRCIETRRLEAADLISDLILGGVQARGDKRA